MNIIQLILIIAFALVWLFDFHRYSSLREEIREAVADKKPFVRRFNIWLATATLILSLLFAPAYYWSTSAMVLFVVGVLLVVAETLLILWEWSLSTSIASEEISQSLGHNPS